MAFVDFEKTSVGQAVAQLAGISNGVKKLINEALGRDKKLPNTLTFYDILGISNNATGKQIKQAHGKLAKKIHPDKSSNPNANDAFKLVGAAYRLLTNETDKKSYNDYLMKPKKNLDHSSRSSRQNFWQRTQTPRQEKSYDLPDLDKSDITHAGQQQLKKIVEYQFDDFIRVIQGARAILKRADNNFGRTINNDYIEPKQIKSNVNARLMNLYGECFSRGKYDYCVKLAINFEENFIQKVPTLKQTLRHKPEFANSYNTLTSIFSKSQGNSSRRTTQSGSNVNKKRTFSNNTYAKSFAKAIAEIENIKDTNSTGLKKMMQLKPTDSDYTKRVIEIAQERLRIDHVFIAKLKFKGKPGRHPKVQQLYEMLAKLDKSPKDNINPMAYLGEAIAFINNNKNDFIHASKSTFKAFK